MTVIIGILAVALYWPLFRSRRRSTDGSAKVDALEPGLAAR